MSNPKYDLLNSEFEAIVKRVETVPPGAQEAAFNALVSALLSDGKSNAAGEALNADVPKSVEDSPVLDVVSEERDYVAEIKQDVEQHKLGDRSDIEFVTYVAHYFVYRAPVEHRVDFITKDHVKKAFSLASRKPPKGSNYITPLKNAKQKGLVESGGKRGQYRPSDEGKYHVEQVMLKAES